MYGISQGNEGSWNWAAASTDLSAETRYVASGSHFRPSESVPPSLLPQINANGFRSGLDDLMELKRRDRYMRESKMWALERMVLSIGKRTGKQRRINRDEERKLSFPVRLRNCKLVLFWICFWELKGLNYTNIIPCRPWRFNALTPGYRGREEEMEVLIMHALISLNGFLSFLSPLFLSLLDGWTGVKMVIWETNGWFFKVWDIRVSCISLRM